MAWKVPDLRRSSVRDSSQGRVAAVTSQRQENEVLRQWKRLNKSDIFEYAASDMTEEHCKFGEMMNTPYPTVEMSRAA